MNLKKTKKEQLMLCKNILDKLLDVKKKIEYGVQILKNSKELHRIAVFLEFKRIEISVSEAHIDVYRLNKEYQIYTLDVQMDETVQKFSFDTFGEIKVEG